MFIYVVEAKDFRMGRGQWKSLRTYLEQDLQTTSIRIRNTLETEIWSVQTIIE